MNIDDWNDIVFFSPSEKWGDPLKMDFNLVKTLDHLRDFLGRPIVIHCGFEPRPTGYHPQGLAVDCHAEGLHVLDFFTAVTRFGFHGIGVYPWWNNPGLHLDMRPIETGGSRSLWGSTADKSYVALSSEFYRFCLETT